MNPITFPQVNRIYAKDDKTYFPLPARVNDHGLATTCWKMSFKERLKVLFTGRIWVDIRTFNEGIQPQRLYIDDELL